MYLKEAYSNHGLNAAIEKKIGVHWTKKLSKTLKRSVFEPRSQRNNRKKNLSSIYQEIFQKVPKMGHILAVFGQFLGWVTSDLFLDYCFETVAQIRFFLFA